MATYLAVLESESRPLHELSVLLVQNFILLVLVRIVNHVDIASDFLDVSNHRSPHRFVADIGKTVSYLTVSALSGPCLPCLLELIDFHVIQ
jgi:hypothetical protein